MSDPCEWGAKLGNASLREPDEREADLRKSTSIDGPRLAVVVQASETQRSIRQSLQLSSCPLHVTREPTRQTEGDETSSSSRPSRGAQSTSSRPPAPHEHVDVLHELEEARARSVMSCAGARWPLRRCGSQGSERGRRRRGGSCLDERDGAETDGSCGDRGEEGLARRERCSLYRGSDCQSALE